MTDNTKTPTISRADLEAELRATGLTRDQAHDALDALQVCIADALISGRRVKLFGLGTLQPKARPAKSGVMRGVSYSRPAGWRVTCRSSAPLMRLINAEG